MIKKARPGERVALPDGTIGRIKQVQRERPDAHCGRVTVLTTPDGRWHMAAELRRVDRIKRQ